MIQDDEELIMSLAKGSIQEYEAIKQMSSGDFLTKLKHHLNGLRQNNNEVGN